mmetsp:Transcript_7099/g.26578  ORF Transcript_7099/g.26578 Transcript_7099/m.26578 type:complete len:224 (+) Transcript_7099:246-917(+)
MAADLSFSMRYFHVTRKLSTPPYYLSAACPVDFKCSKSLLLEEKEAPHFLQLVEDFDFFSFRCCLFKRFASCLERSCVSASSEVASSALLFGLDASSGIKGAGAFFLLLLLFLLFRCVFMIISESSSFSACTSSSWNVGGGAINLFLERFFFFFLPCMEDSSSSASIRSSSSVGSCDCDSLSDLAESSSSCGVIELLSSSLSVPSRSSCLADSFSLFDRSSSR